MNLKKTLAPRAASVALRALVLAAAFVLGLEIDRPAQAANVAGWQKSIVTMEIARKQYDYTQPWARRNRRQVKVGTVVEGRMILTSADEVYDRTLVRLQKMGRGRWYIGEVAWVDYPANLALVTTKEDEFWEGLAPARFGVFAPEKNLQILRWRDGNLEARSAEFTRFTVREGQLTPANQVVMETTSEISGVGWGEPLVANSEVVGMVWGQDGRVCSAAPASFVRSVLEARQEGKFKGLGFFHFYWQPAENPATLGFLKLTGPPRGVFVSDVPERPDGREQVLKERDLILKIDDFDIGVEGNYVDPEYGALMLEALATRNRWAGDSFRLTIWRDGQEQVVNYQLPAYALTNDLVPRAPFDQEPEYLVIGGLVFQPLTDSYLMTWGAEWKRRAPFRLLYYNTQPASKERPALVVLTEILPDPYNIGYQDYRYLVLDKVNGQPVSRLADLRAALQRPEQGRHVLEFVKSDSLRRMVLAAGDAQEAATDRILKSYGIPTDYHLAEGGAK